MVRATPITYETLSLAGQEHFSTLTKRAISSRYGKNACDKQGVIKMMMNQLMNGQLLSILLGSDGELLAKRSLAELFGLKTARQNKNLVAEAVSVYAVPNKLLAARELLRRALEESMAEEAYKFNSPQVVKDYLRLHFGGFEEEHFVALWLDTQHRLIAVDHLFRGTLTQTSGIM